MYRKNTSGQFFSFQLVLAATGAAGTGLTPTVRRCIDGTFAAATGSATEDTGTGNYKFAMSQADTNGNNIGFGIAATGCIPICVNILTTAADPTDGVRFGLTALPNAAADAAGGLPISDAGGLDMDTRLNHLDADISTRSTYAGGAVATVTGSVGSVVGLTASDVGAIKAKTDNLPSDPADESLIIAATNSLSALIGTPVTSVAADIAAVKAVDDAIKSKTDNLPASPAAVGDIPTAADNADAVWDEAIADHAGVGSTGEALSAAGAAGDPWATALPGLYGPGTAGQIIGDYVDAAISDIPTATENADALLDRDMSAGADNGSASVRTPRQALRFPRNKFALAGNTLTVYKEDDATVSWSGSLTTDANAEPIVGGDPAGP